MRENLTISTLDGLLKPYVHKKLFEEPYVEHSDVKAIRLILSHYYNVKVSTKDKHFGYAYLNIQVSGLFSGGVREYEIRERGQRKRLADSLGWIDEIEAIDALFDDK
ncbi:MAG: hypothetical protein ACI39G_06395 [Pseudoramibacter sp.]